MVCEARPFDIDRRDVTYPNMERKGTRAFTTLLPGRSSIPSTWPMRALKSEMTSPRCSSGVAHSTDMIGSRIVGLAFAQPDLYAIDAATLKAISLESTSCEDPSSSEAR